MLTFTLIALITLCLKISECPECQAKRNNLKIKKAYIPIEVTEPLELVGMDLIGKLTPTKSGHQYICVIIDYFTKWTEAYPLKTKEAAKVTQGIMDFFYRFGAPKRLLTDQGREFVNQLNYNVCEMLKKKRSLCAPYHPQTNGLVEKMNGTIQRTLTKLVRDSPQTWDEHLNATLFALRTKKQLTTQFSPYFLMFGREARYPVEVPASYEVTEDQIQTLVSNGEISQTLALIQKHRQMASENMSKVREKIKRKREKAGVDVNFEVGDKVLRKNIREEQRKGGKMETSMLGPFSIKNIDGKSADIVTKKESTYKE